MTNTLTQDSKGFVIRSDGVEMIGDVKKEKLVGKRQITYNRQDARKPCSVNGTVLNQGCWTWFNKTENMASCFVKWNGTQVIIDMASEGYVCVDYDTLYHFTEIKMNTKSKVKDSSYSIPVKSSKIVMMNGEPLSTELYEMRNDKHYLSRDLKLSEQIYLVHDDGSFTDVIFSVIRAEDDSLEGTSLVIEKPLRVYIKKDFRGVPPVLNGIRATGDIPSITGENGRKKDMMTKITHYTGELNLYYQLVFLTEAEYAGMNITQENVHELQEMIVRYANYGYYYNVEIERPDQPFADVKQELVFKPTKYLTKLKLYTSDDVEVDGYVTRIIKNIQKVDGGVVRLVTPELLTTDRFYVLNGTFYRTSTGKITQPIENNSTFSTYDGKTGTWVSYTKLGEAKVNKSYTIVLVDEQEKSFNLKNIGSWPANENVSFQINDKQVQSTLKLKENEIDKELNLKIILTSTELECTIKFIVDSRTKTSLLIPGEDDFESIYTRRTSFYNTSKTADEHVWSYGRFVAPINQPIYAYNTTVLLTTDGVCVPSTTKYPVIDYLSDRTCKLIKTMKYHCELLNENKIIELGKDDIYMRLNACADVAFSNSVITVSATTGLCYFVAGDTFHVYRSGLLRKRSGGLSALGSPVNSPHGSYSARPSAVAESQSESVTDAVVKVATTTVSAVTSVGASLIGVGKAIVNTVTEPHVINNNKVRGVRIRTKQTLQATQQAEQVVQQAEQVVQQVMQNAEQAAQTALQPLPMVIETPSLPVQQTPPPKFYVNGSSFVLYA